MSERYFIYTAPADDRRPPPPAMVDAAVMRRRFEVHFLARCAEREIPLTVERIGEMMRRMKPCWRREGRTRHTVSVRFGRGRLATIVWDADLEAPVTAWWRSVDKNDPHPVCEEWR